VFNLEGKVAVVTGAALGQGRQHVLRLVQEGVAVVAIDLARPDPSSIHPIGTSMDLESLRSEVTALGGTISIHECDVTAREDMRAIGRSTFKTFGRIDIVIANAALFNVAPAMDITGEQWDRSINVTLTGAWNTFVSFIPHMISAGNGGSVISIGSTAASKGIAGLAAYVSAKHGLLGLTKTLAIELGPHFIRANMISPTSTNTTMLRNEETIKLFTEGMLDQQRFEEVLKSTHVIPVPWVEVDDISNAMLFLASNLSRFITGSVLPVDAGYIVK
jgi:(+)-trans-carveol dehydrogenase